MGWEEAGHRSGAANHERLYLGTFGVLGLITSFSAEGQRTLLLEPSRVPLALVLMHSYPRFGAVLLQNIVATHSVTNTANATAVHLTLHGW